MTGKLRDVCGAVSLVATIAVQSGCARQPCASPQAAAFSAPARCPKDEHDYFTYAAHHKPTPSKDDGVVAFVKALSAVTPEQLAALAANKPSDEYLGGLAASTLRGTGATQSACRDADLQAALHAVDLAQPSWTLPVIDGVAPAEVKKRIRDSFEAAALGVVAARSGAPQPDVDVLYRRLAAANICWSD